MREFKAQESIVNISFNKQKLPKDEKGLKAYKFLVYYRFFEVLSNAFPLFFAQVDEKKFKKVVYAFMQSGAKSNVMWKVPNEFRAFVKKHKYFKDIKYINDLLWFEWIEVKLLMKSEKTQVSNFAWEKEYQLNSSAAIKKLNYRVFQGNDYEKEGEFYLLAYYDFKTKEVYYREISSLLYLFLKKLNKSGLKKALKHIALLSDESVKNVRNFFQDTLKELNTLGILKDIS